MENKNEFAKLENALSTLGRHIVSPANPSVVPSVQEVLLAQSIQKRTWVGSRNLRWSAVLVLMIAMAFVIFPEPRDAFAQWIGLSNARLASTLTPTLAVVSTPSPLVSQIAPTFQTTSLPTTSSTPSTQSQNPGAVRQIQPPRSIPQPTHP